MTPSDPQKHQIPIPYRSDNASVRDQRQGAVDAAALQKMLRQMQEMADENRKLSAFLAEHKASTEKVRGVLGKGMVDDRKEGRMQWWCGVCVWGERGEVVARSDAGWLRDWEQQHMSSATPPSVQVLCYHVVRNPTPLVLLHVHGLTRHAGAAAAMQSLRSHRASFQPFRLPARPSHPRHLPPPRSAHPPPRIPLPSSLSCSSWSRRTRPCAT